MRQKANKRYGQHFLESAAVAARIVDLADIRPGDFVLEIGPGRGALTGLLLERQARVVAVEIDPELIPELTAKYGANANLQLEQADILRCDVDALLRASQGRLWKLVSNLPYNEATAILQRCIEIAPQLLSMTVMVQREVADRLLAGPGSKTIGYLTHLLGFHFEMRRGFGVRPGCFRPPPKVFSTVFQLIPRREVTPLADYRLYQQLLQHGFAQRRKTLCNALRGVIHDDELTRHLLQQRGLSPTVRAEGLSRDDFVWLAQMLSRAARESRESPPMGEPLL